MNIQQYLERGKVLFILDRGRQQHVILYLAAVLTGLGVIFIPSERFTKFYLEIIFKPIQRTKLFLKKKRETKINIRSGLFKSHSWQKQWKPDRNMFLITGFYHEMVVTGIYLLLIITMIYNLADLLVVEVSCCNLYCKRIKHDPVYKWYLHSSCFRLGKFGLKLTS